MSDQSKTIARLVDGIARVSIDGRTVSVSRNNEYDRENICPVELISAALGSWIVLTISAVADNKKIKLDGLEITISRNSIKKDQAGSSFRVEVKIDSDLTKREKILLINSARKCDVSKLLSGKSEFEYHLEDGVYN